MPSRINRPRRAKVPGQRRKASGPGVQSDYQFLEDFYIYALDFDALVSGTSANGNIQIQADSAFKWISAAYYCDIAAAAFLQSTQPIPNITVQITDNGSGRQLVSNPVPVPSMFGTGILPFLLPVPRIFEPRSSIAFVVSNFDAGVDYNLKLALIGTKIFEAGAGS